jgi:hypothetical protein
VQSLPGIASPRPACLLFLALFVGGCGNNLGAAINPDEFRREGANGVERVDVDRPLRAVAAAFRDRADACLNTTTVIQGGANVRYTMDKRTYTARVIATDARAELHLQVRFWGLTFHEQGKDGAYILLADATPLDARRTRLEVRYAGLVTEPLRSAVRGWASGSFSGCPDLTR